MMGQLNLLQQQRHISLVPRPTKEPSMQACELSTGLESNVGSGRKVVSRSKVSRAPSGTYRAGLHHQSLRSKTSPMARQAPRSMAARRETAARRIRTVVRLRATKIRPMASKLIRKVPKAFQQALQHLYQCQCPWLRVPSRAGTDSIFSRWFCPFWALLYSHEAFKTMYYTKALQMSIRAAF